MSKLLLAFYLLASLCCAYSGVGILTVFAIPVWTPPPCAECQCCYVEPMQIYAPPGRTPIVYPGGRCLWYVLGACR